MGIDQKESVQALLSSISHDIKERIRSIRGRIFFITEDKMIIDPGSLALLKRLDEKIKEIGDIVANFRKRPTQIDFETITEFIQNELNRHTEQYLLLLNQLILLNKSSHAVKELDAIFKHSKRMNRIIDGINAYAKSYGQLTRSKFAIHNELDRIKNDLEHTISESRASVKHNGLVQFNGDQLKIAQLFQNLIQNSITYAKTDTNPEIQIELKNFRGKELPEHLKLQLDNFYDEEAYFYASVSDNGIGIADEYIKKVFNIQFRINRDRQIDEKGGGLGLAIVKSIADAHEGAVWLESKIDVGTTVHVLLLNKTRTI